MREVILFLATLQNEEAGYMLFFMLHHRIFGETLNLDHSLSLTAQTKQSKSVKMLSSTLNFYLLVPYDGGGVYTNITRRNCKCQMQIAHLIFRYVFTICKFLFFISGERTQVIIMFFAQTFIFICVEFVIFTFFFRQWWPTKNAKALFMGPFDPGHWTMPWDECSTLLVQTFVLCCHCHLLWWQGYYIYTTMSQHGFAYMTLYAKYYSAL